MEQQQQRNSKLALRSLDRSELFFFLQTTQVAIGFLSLPRIVVEDAGHDGWMGIPIAGVVVQLSAWVMIRLLRRFGGHDLYEILRKLFGKWGGNIVGALFALYCLYASIYVLASYSNMIITWLFPTTSGNWMIYLLVIMPSVYCATGGSRILGRFAVITFFATFWMSLFYVPMIPQIETIDMYRPVLDASPGELLKAGWDSMLSMLGYELILIVYPAVQKKEKVMRTLTYMNLFTTLLYLIPSVIAIGFMGEGMIKHELLPIVSMNKIFESPILERMENLLNVFWAFLIVNTGANYLWAAGRYLNDMKKWQEPRGIYLILPLVIAFGFVPSETELVMKMGKWLGYVGAVMVLVLPLVIWLLAILMRKKGNA